MYYCNIIVLFIFTKLEKREMLLKKKNSDRSYELSWAETHSWPTHESWIEFLEFRTECESVAFDPLTEATENPHKEGNWYYSAIVIL